MLYDKVAELEETWLKNEVKTRIVDLITPAMVMESQGSYNDISMERRTAGERFMTSLKDACKDHQLSMGMITDVLMYMVGARSSAAGWLLTGLGSNTMSRRTTTIDICHVNGTVPAECPANTFQ